MRWKPFDIPDKEKVDWVDGLRTVAGDPTPSTVICRQEMSSSSCRRGRQQNPARARGARVRVQRVDGGPRLLQQRRGPAGGAAAGRAGHHHGVREVRAGGVSSRA